MPLPLLRLDHPPPLLQVLALLAPVSVASQAVLGSAGYLQRGQTGVQVEALVGAKVQRGTGNARAPTLAGRGLTLMM